MAQAHAESARPRHLKQSHRCQLHCAIHCHGTGRQGSSQRHPQPLRICPGYSTRHIRAEMGQNDLCIPRCRWPFVRAHAPDSIHSAWLGATTFRTISDSSCRSGHQLHSLVQKSCRPELARSIPCIGLTLVSPVHPPEPRRGNRINRRRGWKGRRISRHDLKAGLRTRKP